MDLKIRKGTMQDVPEISVLYDTLNDYLAAHTNYPGWKKGIYPTGQDAIEGVKDNGLYVAIIEDKIVGSFVVRNKPEKAYGKARWEKELSYDKVFVIHTFVVHPLYFNQNIGSQLLGFIEEMGKESGMESLRLDVYEHNLPAIHLYEKNKFKYIDTVDLGLGEHGLNWFKLYEKLLETLD